MKIPPEWTFASEEVAAHFDGHVRGQLPWYDLVSDAVVEVARHFIPEGGLVYDVGCSTGNIGRRLAGTLEAKRAEFIGIEKSESMAARYVGPGRVVVGDALAYEFERFDVAIVFLTLMFFPVSERGAFLRRLRSRMRPGGAIIIVEKTLPVGGWLSTVFSRVTLRAKLASGEAASSILEKELSLGGSQRPIDPEILGPDAVEFFRFGDFAGYVVACGEDL